MQCCSDSNSNVAALPNFQECRLLSVRASVIYARPIVGVHAALSSQRVVHGKSKSSVASLKVATYRCIVLIGMAGMRCNSFCVLSMAKDELHFSDHVSETLHSHININIHLFAIMSEISLCVVAILHAFCQVTLAEATWRAKVRLPHFDS